MTTILVWAWGGLCSVAASLCFWPWVERWFYLPGDDWRLMRWPMAVGLSLGGLTLWMLVAGFWRLDVWVALAFPALVLLLSARSARSKFDLKNSALSAVKSFFLALRRGELKAWITLGGLIALAVVLGQATYYPFIGEDEISRYAYYARLIFTQGRVSAEVRGYPMFLPLAYSYIFFVTGQLAEQLARLIPVGLSVSTVIATAALGRRWFGARGGWAAAFVLIATPLYLHWSPNGYLDIPSALYFVLGAYAADVWLKRREMRWATLAGVLVGLALWTKQAGFAMLPGLGIVFAWATVRDWRGGRSESARRVVRDGVMALLVAFFVGGLWYFRNAYYDGLGNAVPGPGSFYSQQANRGLTTLIPFIGEFVAFGVFASPLYLAGMVWGAFTSLRGGVLPLKQFSTLPAIAASPVAAGHDSAGQVWALVWCIPYTVLWWWLFSYDPRFLLTVLPFYALLVGGMIASASPIQFVPKIAARWAMAALIMAGVGLSVVGSKLGGLRQWVVAPTATYAERLVRAKGDLYPAVEFLRDHIPPDARVLSMDGRLKYYLIERPISVYYPYTLKDLAGYDYFVVGSWWPSAYAGLGQSNSEVLRAFDDPQTLQQVYSGPTGGLVVYRVVRP
nr:glycosyltransferase family 39 protein [Chloroflexota bacterium]